MHGYNTYQVNSSNELHDGSAILIKTNVRHRMNDDFISDFIAITMETSTGPINIATSYLPPRKPYPDIHSIATFLPTY